MKQLQSKKGFTLIEVLIVVGIIGILSSVILVGLNSSRSRARDTAALPTFAKLNKHSSFTTQKQAAIKRWKLGCA
ncbi:MAG: type II secretion system protein [Candidatus Paceibacterota bacterium]